MLHSDGKYIKDTKFGQNSRTYCRKDRTELREHLPFRPIHTSRTGAGSGNNITCRGNRESYVWGSFSMKCPYEGVTKCMVVPVLPFWQRTVKQSVELRVLFTWSRTLAQQRCLIIWDAWRAPDPSSRWHCIKTIAFHIHFIAFSGSFGYLRYSRHALGAKACI